MRRRSSRASRGRPPRRPPARRRSTPAGSGTAAPTQPQANIDIVVDGGRIKSVAPHSDALHAGTVVDASRDTVIPGSIEIHTHLSKDFGEALGRAFLAWGITTVRNPATNAYDTREYREAFESGARIGPRLFTTGEPFDGSRIYYPGGMSLDDTGQLPLALQHAREAGFDFVKTYVRMPDLMQKRIIEEAHGMGMPVTSHELYPAVAFGADGVEHIRGTSRRGYSPKISGLSRSYRDVIDLLTASKMTLTPTIGIQGGFRLQTLRDSSWLNDPRIERLYPPAVAQRWREQTKTPASAETLEDAARLVTPQERTVYEIVKGGGRITAGTDSPINPYGLALLMELENYASGGLTPIEVLRTATIVSAEAMGAGADLGSIEPGKLADLTMIDGDPLTNIKDLRRVRRVMKGGEVFDVETLLQRPQAGLSQGRRSIERRARRARREIPLVSLRSPRPLRSRVTTVALSEAQGEVRHSGPGHRRRHQRLARADPRRGARPARVADRRPRRVRLAADRVGGAGSRRLVARLPARGSRGPRRERRRRRLDCRHRPLRPDARRRAARRSRQRPAAGNHLVRPAHRRRVPLAR